jgi:hypothetical protein
MRMQNKNKVLVEQYNMESCAIIPLKSLAIYKRATAYVTNCTIIIFMMA